MKKTLLAALLFLLSPASAIQPEEVLQDGKLEARARTIDKELRCPVCQSQSIDESDAPLARDLRLVVRARLQQGDSDEKVKQFVVARYGTYVLLKPPIAPSTYLLWFGPLLLIGAGGIAVLLHYRRRPLAAPAPLTADERRRLQSLEGDT